MKHLIQYKLFESLDEYCEFSKEERDEIAHYFTWMDDDGDVAGPLWGTETEGIFNFYRIKDNGKIMDQKDVKWNSLKYNTLRIRLYFYEKNKEEIELIINKLIKINDCIVVVHIHNHISQMLILKNTPYNLEAAENMVYQNDKEQKQKYWILYK